MFPRQTKQMDTVFIKELFQARDARRPTVNKRCRDYTKLAGISPEARALAAPRHCIDAVTDPLALNLVLTTLPPSASP
jgi:hypothetical protein